MSPLASRAEVPKEIRLVAHLPRSVCSPPPSSSLCLCVEWFGPAPSTLGCGEFGVRTPFSTMPRRTRPIPGALAEFHPLIRKWFEESLGEPSPPQREGWPAIASANHTLILAPTGTGKTLAAFLWELNRLIVDGAATPLPNAVQILYVSPLKALNNDIQRNLEGPLGELRERFEAAGEPFPEIRVAVRTGDTPQSARARMIRKSPHILITTRSEERRVGKEGRWRGGECAERYE